MNAMKLTTHGVKANDRTVELGKMNLFTGPNGAGKTTIPDSIRFLALGYVPALGKLPVATAALMAEATMEVELTLPDGRTVKRTLVRTDAGGFQQTAECSWLKNTKATETGKVITRLFGDEEIDVREMLDIRQLLSAPPNERASRIEPLLEGERRPAKETAAAVARLTMARLVPKLGEENIPENYLDLLPLLAKGHKATLKEHAAMLEAKIADGGIAEALAWANEEKKLASTGLNRKEQAAKELRMRSVEVPEPDEREIEKLHSDRDALQRDLGALAEQERQYSDKVSQRRELAEAADIARGAFEDAARALAQIQRDSDKQLADLQKRSDQAMKKIETLETPAAPSSEPLAKLQKDVDALRSEIEGIQLPEVPDTNGEIYAVKQVEDQLRRAKSSLYAEVLEIAIDLKKVDKVKARAARLEVIAREGLGVDPEGLEHELGRCKAALKEAVAASQKAREERVRIELRRTSLETTCSKKASELNRTRSSANEAHVKALAEFDLEKRKLLGERQDAERKLALLRTEVERSRGRHKDAEARHERLQAQLQGVGELPPKPPSSGEISAKLQATKAALDRLVEARVIHGEIQHHLQSIEEAQSTRDVFASIEWALQRQREIEIAEAGGPLKKHMAKFLEAAGRKERPFLEAGATGIGWITDEERRVRVEALSGGEWALYTAALTAAVLLCRAAEVKTLLIEAGETDQKTLGQILRGVKAVSKGLTAAVVLTPHAPEVVEAGWNVVQVSKETATAAA